MKIALFTSAHWNSPELIGRLRGIAEILGWTILPGLVEDSIQLSIVEQADLVVFLKDFPHRWEDFRKIVEKAQLAGKPIVLDLHEFSFKLPVAHTYRRDQQNKNSLYALFQSILEADALLVSTADTAEFLTAINSSTYVMPDGINERLWPAFQTRQRQEDDHDQGLTIGYAGYDINTGDFSLVTPVLKRLLEYYSPGLQVVIFGSRPPQELLDQEGVVWVPVDMLDYPKYAQAVQAHPIDIGITPLVLHPDNKFISPVNFFEYTAVGAVGVYTRFGAYEQVVEHQATGFLASSSEEWQHYLVQLIESPTLRSQMAQNARKVVEEKWLLSHQSSHWEQALNTILSKGTVPVDPARQLLWDLTQEVKTWDQDLDWELEYERQQSSKLIQERNHALRERDEGREMIIQLNDDLEKMYRSREYLQGSRIVRLMDAVAARGTWGEKLLSLGERTAQKIYQVIAKPAPREGSQGISPPQIAPAFSYDVFVFPMFGMENRLHRAHHFAREFAREGHRVFYIDSQFYPHTRMVITPIDERIYEIRLPASPEQTGSLGIDFDQKALAMDAVTHLCEVISIQDAVLFVDWLYWAPVVSDLRHHFNWKVIWDVLDINLNDADPLVERLNQVSDLVVYSSEFVSDQQKRKQPNWMLIKNGADFEPFADRTHYIPQDLAHLQGPVIGYHGPLSKAFDLSLVTELARNNPEWQFVLLGAVSSEAFAQLQGASNIHIFGHKPDRELPAYVQAFDLCIIPLQEAPGTNTAAPLLLFDYLSAGKPVVASRLVALEGYSEYVSFAQGVEAWEEQIGIALANPGPEVIQKRVVFARKNSWMVRHQELSQQIVQVYPKVSIVILTYNNLAYNQYCLESIFSHTQYPNLEVIVVDNASTDGTPDFLRAFAENRSNILLQLNVENKGFAGGNNQGARLASGDYIVFLNNDTVVTPGWLSRLITHLKDPGVGMVGPVTNSSGNESCIPVDYSYLDGMIPFAGEYTKKHAGRAFQIPMLAFMCVAMRRSVFDEVGFLDERFGVGMFEDDDYAYRLKLKGYKILCAEDVFIHHWGSASFSKLQEERYKKLFGENKRKFEEKWGKKWKPHQFRQGRD